MINIKIVSVIVESNFTINGVNMYKRTLIYNFLSVVICFVEKDIPLSREAPAIPVGYL